MKGEPPLNSRRDAPRGRQIADGEPKKVIIFAYLDPSSGGERVYDKEKKMRALEKRKGREILGCDLGIGNSSF